jgi:hypothetical protein
MGAAGRGGDDYIGGCTTAAAGPLAIWNGRDRRGSAVAVPPAMA